MSVSINIGNMTCLFTELIAHVDRMSIALEEAHKEIAEAKGERQMILVRSLLYTSLYSYVLLLIILNPSSN